MRLYVLLYREKGTPHWVAYQLLYEDADEARAAFAKLGFTHDYYDTKIVVWDLAVLP